jgi:tRNA (guanine-N7-)-methyltransferase
MYECALHIDDDNIYNKSVLPEELKIRTHYESMDIAGSNRVHYLCFSLPQQIASKEKDEELKQVLKDHAGTY